MNKVIINTAEQVLVEEYYKSLGHMPRSGIAGLYMVESFLVFDNSTY